MAGPIQIDVTANVAEAESGLAKLGSGFDTVDKVLDRLSDNGAKVSRSLVSSFLDSERAAKMSAEDIERVLTKSYSVPADEAKRMARIVSGELDGMENDVKRTADELERDMTDAFDQTADESKRMSEEVADNADSGFKKAAESATSSASEVGRSVGDLGRDIADGFESGSDALSGVGDLLANVLPGAAGVAVGALVGVTASMVAAAEEDTEKQKQLVSSMYEDMIESGNNYVSQDFINRSIQETIDDQEKMKDVFVLVKAAGIEEADAIRALSGDNAALSEVLASVTDQYDALNAKKDRSDGDRKMLDLLKDQIDKLTLLGAAADSAAGRSDKYREATEKSAAANEKAAAKAKEVTAAINEIPASKNSKVTVTADTSAVDKALREIDGRKVRVQMIPQAGVPVL